jgi:HEAT repeat protein
MEPRKPGELISMLDSPMVEERLTAIRILGEIGDAEALAALRTRLKIVSAEHQALVIAIGKWKRRLKVK